MQKNKNIVNSLAGKSKK